MTRYNLIRAISSTLVAMMVLLQFLNGSVWAYVCYAVIVVGAVCVFTIQHKSTLDEKIKKPQLLMLAGALLFTIAFSIFQYYQLF